MSVLSGRNDLKAVFYPLTNLQNCLHLSERDTPDMDNSDKINELESENRRLREQLSEIEKQLAIRRRTRSRLILLAVRTFAGRPLYTSVNQLVDEVAERRLERETIKKVMYATLHRITRVGVIMLTIALGPLMLAGLQTYYLKKQNEKLDIQNDRIEQQTVLQEAERRSSLVFLFDNVLNKIDEELQQSPVRRNLSPQLIGRIVALTKALKPYRFLDGDTITSGMSSPERGQVLLSILASKLSQKTYDQIFLLADFSYATLENVSLEDAYLRNINLAHAQLTEVSFTGADLRNANLEGAVLNGVHVLATGADARPARFDFANLHNARIINCDFGGSTFDYTNFADANLHQVSFRRSFFNQTKFADIQADTLDFGAAVFINTAFSLAPVKQPASLHFQWQGIRLDTSSYRQISGLALLHLPVPDTALREFHITRDTFYPNEDSPPVVVVDSVELFGIRRQ